MGGLTTSGGWQRRIIPPCAGPHGDAIMAIGVLRAFGVPDATMAGADLMPLLQCKPFGMSAKHLAELLEIPVTRFDKLELRQAFTF